MSVSPMYAGQTLPLLLVPWLDDANTPVSIQGATLALIIYNTITGAVQTGAGAWQINNGATSAVYTWAASDVAAAGQYDLIPAAIFPAGVMYADAIPWAVNALPSGIQPW